mgnify:CR=1 FL=1
MTFPNIYGVRGATAKTQDQVRAEGLAAELSLPVLPDGQEADAVLEVEQNRVSVLLKALPAGEERLELNWVRIDTSSSAGKNRRQPLLRAIRGRKKRLPGTVVLDCTAGLGQDTWILAAMGCAVIAVERNPLIFALLRDELARAGIARPRTARRIRLCSGDAQHLLQSYLSPATGEDPGGRPVDPPLPPRPEVIMLDPLFPAYQKRKAAEKKSMRLLRLLADDGRDQSGVLLDLALQVAGSRVILKRPLKASALVSDLAPLSHQIQGKGLRYDIYIRPAVGRTDR